MEKKKIVAAMSGGVDSSMTAKLLADAGCDVFGVTFLMHRNPGCTPPFVGAEEVCRTLSRDYDLYLITNGNAAVQHGRFDPSPIRKYFKDCFISDEIGAEKPSAAFFEIVRSRIPGNDAIDACSLS